MSTIIKQEWKNYFRNPILWIGIVVVFILAYISLAPYLTLHYFESNEEIQNAKSFDSGDFEVIEGYIPATEKQIKEKAFQRIKNIFLEEYKFSEDKVNSILDEIHNVPIENIPDYLEDKYKFYGSDYYFDYMYKYQKQDKESVNQYISENLSKHNYSYYFSRKAADFIGLNMAFFATILLAFLFFQDTRKDKYELLHTKPIRGYSYIAGKVLGGLGVTFFVLCILITIFNILCYIQGKNAGLPVDLWHIPVTVFIYVMPCMLMITCVYTIIALALKNPLPAIPLLLLYMIYSNMGSYDAKGYYGYFGKPLAIMVRFPGQLFDVSPPPMSQINQIMLIAVSFLLVFIATLIWDRRKVY